jgi:ATP-dependent DNA helicase RecG
MKPLSFSSSVADLGGVAKLPTRSRRPNPPVYVVLEEAFGITTVLDLLQHFPRRYLDRSNLIRIRDMKIGQEGTIVATVRKVRTQYTRRRQAMVTVTVADESGPLQLFWFNQSWPAKRFKEGQEVMASGKLGLFRGVLRMQNPTVDVLRGGDEDAIHTGRIIPVHPATEGVSPGMIRRLIFDSLRRLSEVPDPIPQEVVRAEGLIDRATAFREIHFPEAWERLEDARQRLKFDELFTLELGVAFRKHRIARKESGVAHERDGVLLKRFQEAMPFELTEAQRRSISEVADAMAGPHPMNLLLQGDVGSGKTVVALAAAMIAIGSGHQAAIMAPTEVLAAQHYRSVAALLAPIGALDFLSVSSGGDGQESLLDASDEDGGPSFALLTAAVTGRARQRILQGVQDGSVDLVVGTHALVQEGVAFRDLSLAVIDEQHRFGVHQRMALKGKGVSPDALIMTATPIPRTLALTYYGDLDVSVLDEMPAGRQPIDTRIVRSPADRKAAYELVRREVQSGRQAFVVCAAIDEANRLEVKAAEKEAERLRTQVFPDLSVGVLHGRMRPAEKDERMQDFLTGQCDLLISTTVIEVGVDVPNATVMLVENAERFGLAQLHQLRGRIGRGAHKSYCVLFDESAPDNEEARARLEAMARTTDGFELADEDLRLRGEGTLFDIRQSGMPDLKLARLSEDVDLVKRARDRAFAMVEEDPELRKHRPLRKELETRFKDSIEWLFHS